ncbi:MAG: hypothetical protein JW894_16290 [Bacteroidales bacterium]|nr:hypothetical protein [Bacteroidales bacterium]
MTAVRLAFLIAGLFCANILFSQCKLTDIDLDRVPYKKIRKFIKDQQTSHILEFSDIQPSCDKDQDLSEFKEVVDTFITDVCMDQVWEAYKTTSPVQSWNGRIIAFGLQFSKWQDEILYSNGDNFSEIDTGQVFFVNLKLMRFYNLAVGLEIVNVDISNRTIKFSYIKGNKSEGEQTIQFMALENGNTKIIHSSSFRSGSKLRDRIYPFFHTKALNEFHGNILKSLNNNDIAFQQQSAYNIAADTFD